MNLREQYDLEHSTMIPEAKDYSKDHITIFKNDVIRYWKGYSVWLESKADEQPKASEPYLSISSFSKRSELLKIEDKDVSFDDYLKKFYKYPEIELTYKDRNKLRTITEKHLIRQYKRAFRLS